MAAAYVNSVVLQAPSYLLAGPPDGLLDIPARPDLVEAGHLAQRLVGIVVAAAAVDLARCLLALAPDAPTLPAVPEDGVVEVDLDGRRVAQITDDPALITDRRQVDAAARVIAVVEYLSG